MFIEIRSQRQWAMPDIKEGDVKKFKENMEKYGLFESLSLI